MMGATIKAYRRRHKLTQKAFAGQLNEACQFGRISVTARDISAWERAECISDFTGSVPYGAVLVIAQLTGESVVELMTYRNE